MSAARDRHDIDSSDSERWFSLESMKPIHALNEYLLDLLAAEVLRPASEHRVELALELRETIAHLDVEGRQRAVQCPVALIDAGFLDDAMWIAATSGGTTSPSERSSLGNFPRTPAVRLAQMTLTLASTAAQFNLERACLIFGMSPACAQLVSGLSLPQIERLAQLSADWVRPRWEDRPSIWRALLELADRPALQVASIGLRAMQLQLADLALATPVCAAIRQIRR
jgi:hypothetical protein